MKNKIRDKKECDAKIFIGRLKIFKIIEFIER
jgi:hypothetical protein